MTEWMQRLLSADAPENATLQSATLDLRGLFPLWAAAVAVAVLALVVVLVYTREQGRIGMVRRTLLVLLRVAAFGLLFLLLLRPILVAEYQGQRPRGTVLLVDNSESLKQRDRRRSAEDQLRVAIAEGRVSPKASIKEVAASLPKDVSRDPSRLDLVRAALANSQLHLLDDLGRKGPLRTYLFGQGLRDPGRSEAGEDRLNPFPGLQGDEPRTALADAIHDLLTGKEGEPPAAIVAMTDGQDNASKIPLTEVAAECARLGVPLHLYGVGCSDMGVVQIRDVEAPATLFYDDAVSVPVRWRARGIKKQDVLLSLTLGDRVVARRKATPEEMAQGRAVLTFTPRKGEARDEALNLKASVEVEGSPDLRDDLRRPVRLVDQHMRVLVVENTPRWEYKFLQSTLLRDRRVEASFLLTSADTRVLQSGAPFLPSFPTRDKLFAYDLVILGDVPVRLLGNERLGWLRDFVNEGGGLVLSAGLQHAPAEYAGTVLAEVLPVEFLPTRPRNDGTERPLPFTPVLTEAGQRSDMMALADNQEENLRTWKELQGFSWYFPVSKLRPGAVSLLDHPQARLGEEPMPVAAIHNYGRGQVLFLGSDETWRWRYNVGDKHFTRFWGQVVYQLGLPHLLGSSRRVQLGLDHSDAQVGRPGSVYARVFDRDYRPLRAPRIAARLEYRAPETGKTTVQPLMLEAVPGHAGEYRAMLANDRPGSFEVTVEAPELATLPYRVRYPSGHEMEPLGMAEEALRQAAQISGGKFYREEDLHRLAEQLEGKNAAFTRRQEVLLWSPLSLILLVCIVTAEWVLRKFSNLS
jgi:uncharacterized membrane protein